MELTAQEKALFGAIDKNNDGQLNLSEMLDFKRSANGKLPNNEINAVENAARSYLLFNTIDQRDFKEISGKLAQQGVLLY